MIFFGEIGSIRRIETEFAVEWQINSFLRNDLHIDNNWYQSPLFTFGDEQWHLSMWPNWTDVRRDPVSEWIGLHLGRYDGGPPKTFHCSVGIEGSRGVEMKRETEREFSICGGWLLKNFCSQFDLIRHKSRLMPIGHLKIRCTIKVPAAVNGVCSLPCPSVQVAPANRSQSSDKQVVTNDAEDEDDDDNDDSEDDEYEAGDKVSKSGKNSKQQKQKKNARKCGQKALDDFGKLLASGQNSDITMQVGDAEFKAHKLILSARCPVLCAMFKHETEERASNRISIEDCLPDVFGDFLHYLYTGSVQSLTQQNVFGLYRTADKYLADDLKQQCLQHVRDTLSVQTFCESVKLALTHEESDLLQQAIDFATQNLPLIICTVEWQSFIREYPTEANEILIKCICPRS